MLAKEDNSTPVHSSSPSSVKSVVQHSLDCLTNSAPLAWLSLLAFTKSILSQINVAINKRVQSQSPLCLKRRATFPHTGSFVWSNLPSLVWGRWSGILLGPGWPAWLIVGACCCSVCWEMKPRLWVVFAIWGFWSAVDQMAVNLVLILEHDLAKTAFPDGGIRRIEMLNMLPAPSSWLLYTTEGLCLYLAGQQESV